MINAKAIDLKVCTNCNKYHHRNKWNKFDNEALKKAIIGAIRENVEVKEITMPQHKVNPGVNVKGECQVAHENEIYVLPFRIRYTLCHKCGRIDTTYYEGTLQLRNPTKEAIRFVEKNIEKGKEKGVFVTNQENVENGIDYYLTSQRYTLALGRKINRAFKGELKISRKLFTVNKQTSKRVYRVSVSFRFL